MTDQLYISDDDNDEVVFRPYHIDCPLHGNQPMLTFSTDSRSDSPFKIEFCFKCGAEMIMKQIKARGGYAKKVRG